MSTRHHFYPTVVYLTTSKLSVVVLSNAALVTALALARLLKAIFLGELRFNEVQRANETLRFTVLEVCFSLTMFRAELSLRVLALFVALLISKLFHVVADERMNHVRGSGVCDGE